MSVGRPSPPTQNALPRPSEPIRQTLIEQAQTAFSNLGYWETTIDAIANRAGMSTGALYRHFDAKQALFDAVVVQMQSEAAEEVRQRSACAASPWSQLTLAVEIYLEICQRPAFRRLVLEDAPAALGPPRCAEIEQDAVLSVLNEKLLELERSERIAAGSAAVLNALLPAVIAEGLVLLAAEREQGGGATERAPAAIRTFLSAFRTEH